MALRPFRWRKRGRGTRGAQGASFDQGVTGTWEERYLKTSAATTGRLGKTVDGRSTAGRLHAWGAWLVVQAVAGWWSGSR